MLTCRYALSVGRDPPLSCRRHGRLRRRRRERRFRRSDRRAGLGRLGPVGAAARRRERRCKRSRLVPVPSGSDAGRDDRQRAARRQGHPDRDDRRDHAGKPFVRFVLRSPRQVREPHRHRVRARGHDEPREDQHPRLTAPQVAARPASLHLGHQPRVGRQPHRIQRRQDGWLLPGQPRLQRGRTAERPAGAAER